MDRWEHSVPEWAGSKTDFGGGGRLCTARVKQPAWGHLSTLRMAWRPQLLPGRSSPRLPPPPISSSGSHLLLLVPGVRLGLHRHLVIFADGPDETELGQHAEKEATSGSECGTPTSPAFSALALPSGACTLRHFRSKEAFPERRRRLGAWFRMMNLNGWVSFKLEYYIVKFREGMKPESVCKAEGKIRSMRTFGTKTITTGAGEMAQW